MKNEDYQIRYPSIMADLRELGYRVGEETRGDDEWWRQTMPALRVYHDLYGHTLVGDSFEVPGGDPRWPVATRGLRLGFRVNVVRMCADLLSDEQRADLKSVDFSFGHLEAMWSERILPSLEVFARVNGHCGVGKTFVVPSEAPWPEAEWELKLGLTVSNMRSSGNYADQVARWSRLEAIGFVWGHYEHQWSESIFPSLEVFRQVEGHCRVPKAFVVPHELPWPEAAWGINLGRIVASMRSSGTFSAQATRDALRLEEIGFVWDYFEHQWSEFILPVLEVFRQVNGHCCVPAAFVVPHEEPWPERAWGMKLGSVASTIRSNGTFSKQVTRDADRLAAIEFSFDPRQDKWNQVLLRSTSFPDILPDQRPLQVYESLHCAGGSSMAGSNVGPEARPCPHQIRRRGDYSEQRKRDHARLAVIGFEPLSEAAEK